MAASSGSASFAYVESRNTLIRVLAWTSVSITLIYVFNNYLNYWQGWPGVFPLYSTFGIVSESTVAPVEGGALTLALVQLALYLACIVGSYIGVKRSPYRSLREDAIQMTAISNFIIRAAFWGVMLIGLADAIVSFLRVEGLLTAVVGPELATDLGRSNYRGPYVHFPLLVIGIVIAAFTRRALGFHWLALLVVLSELFIVISRFVFAYEQTFQGDLVRFWYGALFLFASAYTLFEDGHVRVDVVYAGLKGSTKGFLNAFGSITLGMVLCWTILIIGMWNQAAIINSSILAYEVSQSTYGMYIKYWMAGFLAIFAVTMNIQFTSFTLDSIADFRNEPGHRDAVESVH